MSLNPFGFSAAQCRVMDEVLETSGGLGVVRISGYRLPAPWSDRLWHLMTLEDGREVKLTAEQEAAWISEPSDVR